MMAKIPDLAAIRDWCLTKFQPRGSYAAASDIPTQTSQLANDSGYIVETGDSSQTTVTFEQATARANVQPGDDLATAFAKLSRYCADLKNVAFTGAYGDLTGTPQSLKNPNALTFTGAVTGSYDGSATKSVAIPSGTNNLLATNAGTWLDAVQGKALNDKITQINSDLQFLNFSGDSILNFYLTHKKCRGCFVILPESPDDGPPFAEYYVEFLRDASGSRVIVRCVDYSAPHGVYVRSIFNENWMHAWVKL